jgi:alpha-amylase/alpha-mannosidase (GH57 family)
MHQPDYRNSSGVMQMPWVFLHAIKDYYDMPWMMARHENVKATYNITPTLIEQLKLYYFQPQNNDKFLSLWYMHPSELQENDRNWLIKICKSISSKKMFENFSRLEELYALDHFNNSELIDLEILYILAWCGVYIKEQSALIQELIARKRDYRHDDKAALLNELSKFIFTIFEYYKKLQLDGRITLSTTPLNHPILPLLIDMNNALEANRSTNIPNNSISLAEDARLHVNKAKEIFEDTFGYLPNGFWPAEGAVDTQSVAMLNSCGVQWIATDEEILFRSLNSRDRQNLYHPYLYNNMRMVFRDHYLSDLIGFTYSKMDAQDAVNNFIEELSRIDDEQRVVFIILDGENAWEFFENNGFEFFDKLYSSFNNLSWCETLTMDEVCTLPTRELKQLAAGSWIHGNFNTWVGHKEKTRAWELIYLTKRDYEHHKQDLQAEVCEKIVEHFLLAESSDWFWWYGDDHYSEFGLEFDELFRTHLISIYTLMDIAPPSDLLVPIVENKSSQNFWLEPQSDISPNINGKDDSFFEWVGCGIVDEDKLFSTMDKVRGPIKKIYYGQDDTRLYFSFEAHISELCDVDGMEIIIEPLGIRGRVVFSKSDAVIGDLDVHIECVDILEMSIDKSPIQEESIFIIFELQKDGRVIQILPGFGELKIDLSNDYSRNWFI